MLLVLGSHSLGSPYGPHAHQLGFQCQHLHLSQRAAFGLLTFTLPTNTEKTGKRLGTNPPLSTTLRLMGVGINIAQFPYAWLALKAEFYTVFQNFPMELSPGHPLW